MVARIQKTLDHLGELSYPAILLLYAANTVVFAFAYAVIETIAGSSLISSVTNTPVTNFFDLLYFSVITATSTGYGDIVPVAYARPFAAVESFLGLMLLAVLVSKLISKKQDAALSGVHQIAFQSAIHEVREDLYIARKDLDRAIQWLDRDSEALTPSEWERITIACDHIDHLLEEIPEFYDTENHLYIIDQRRESLLVEAVQRTLGRLATLIEAFASHGIHLHEHQETASSISKIAATGQRLIPEWDRRSPHRGSSDFEDIRGLVARIEKATH